MAASQPNVQIFNQTELSIPLNEAHYPHLAATIAENENSSFSFVEVVYVDEGEIVRINREHLEHDYVTDIITFRYDDADDKEGIEGTMFCCAPRILEQAKEFSESPEQEFLRIYIHGLLHLVGYDDTTEELQTQMTAKENTYLALAKKQR
ncbi:MAG: rRNA maturation RNase YbeY [Fodinibius sp.]|nr:rRNA maturation RNase YbeY [Fodinibius sp.]